MAHQPGIFVNSKWMQGNGALLKSYNPATGKLNWEGHSASTEDVNQVMQQARKAFPAWSSLAIDERLQYLNDFAEHLQQQSMRIAEAISKETGKPLWEAKIEVSSIIAKVDLSTEAYGRRCSGMMREHPSGRSITRHRPHGAIVVFGPFNFPGHLPQGHIIPALLAGNTVVFKPSELTPLVGEEIFKIWEHCRLPPGVINLVQGSHETGQALIHHPQLDGLFFTGSYRTGKMLSEALGSHPEKILALEMGGNNPLIIGDIHDFKTAAFLTIQSAYLTAGQRCTCARRLIIPEGKKGDQFIETLIDMSSHFKIGPYTDMPEPYMGPVISEQQAKLLIESQDKLQTAGGEILMKMKHLKAGTGFVSPCIIDVTSIQERSDEEIFGPFLQVIRVSSLEEALTEANQTHFGLAAGLLSDRKEEYHYFYRHIRAGIVNWNTQLTGASSAAPFGGIGYSGNHRPSAYYAADYCSYPVASLESNQMKIPTKLPPGLHM